MAYTEATANLELIKWRNDYWSEYVAESRYGRFMGASPTSLFMSYRDLVDGGKDLIIPLVGSLKGRGVGAGLLTGAEEKLDMFDFRVRPVWRRNAVVTKKSKVQFSVIDLLKANKSALKLWSADDMRDRLTDTFSVVAETDTRYDEDEGLSRQVPYAEANATQRNNWLTDNYNRALFGISQANTVVGNMASSLANVDTTNDMWSAGMIDAAKDLAETRDRASGRRALRPYMVGSEADDGFVLFAPTRGFNRLRADPDIKAFNKDSRERSASSNPYFKGGDLEWNGVIIKKVPELPILTGVGASSADVAPGYLCGAQAMTISWGQDPISTSRKDDDYGFIKGVGTEELRGIDKTFFKSTTDVGPGQQHGMVSMFGAV
jgi:N4-gp56 family major capsid protein